VRIYLTYTLPSLLRQTDSNFRIWLDCRPGSEAELEPHLSVFEEVGILVTFDRGRRWLADLPGAPSHCLVARIDSDDCYAPDAVELIRKHHGQLRATQFTEGYVFEAGRRYAYPIKHRSPPFYTLRLQINEKGLVEPPHAGHNAVRDTFDSVILPAGRFCMVRHGKQGTTNALGRAPCWYRPGRPRRIRPGTEKWRRFAATFPVEDPLSFWETRDCPRVMDLLI
jgi:hypothetical protein